MMESFGTFAVRKLSDAGSAVYRKIVFPFVKIVIERKHNSIIGKGAYLYKGTILGGRNYISDRVELANVKMGYSSYVGRDSIISNSRIGKYTCIANMETAIGRHPVKGENISIYPTFYSAAKQYGYTYVAENCFEEVKVADKAEGYSIVIGNDVWIGFGVILTDGVTIGDGAVIGAGSLVTSDVEPYAIYAGTPAKKIGMRFDDETVNKLLKLRWWDKDEAWIKENATLFKNPGEFICKICGNGGNEK